MIITELAKFFYQIVPDYQENISLNISQFHGSSTTSCTKLNHPIHIGTSECDSEGFFIWVLVDGVFGGLLQQGLFVGFISFINDGAFRWCF